MSFYTNYVILIPLYYYSISYSMHFGRDGNVYENTRQCHVFLFNRGRLRDLPFDTQAHNCQNNRQEKTTVPFFYVK